MEKEILYTVKYKKPSWLFWRTIKEVQADGSTASGGRYFILKDQSAIEVPGDFLFEFGKERYALVQRNRKEVDEPGKPDVDGPRLTIVK